MPRHCTICTHPERAEINRAIAERRGSYAAIAAQYAITPDAVRWHKKQHLSPLLAWRAAGAQEVAQADDALARVRALHAQALEALARAEAQAGPYTALVAIREARNCLDLLVELTQELDRRRLATVLRGSEWGRMRLVIAETLYDYPEAARVVVGRLWELERGLDRSNFVNRVGVSGG